MMSQAPQTTHVHVHQNPSNGMGTAAGVCSILGMFTCGLLCPVGLILGLCSVGKQPKGMAITGIIVGAIGSIGYLIVYLFFGGAILVSCGSCIGMSNLAADMAKHQAAAEPVADTIIEYYKINGRLPDEATAVSLIAPFKHEGHGFEYSAGVGGRLFYLEHPGPDGRWDTLDDWQTSWDAVLNDDSGMNDAGLPNDALPDNGQGESNTP